MARPAHIRSELSRLPLFLMLFGVSALSMVVPAAHGLVVRDLEASRAFFYAGLLGLIVVMILSVVHLGRNQRDTALGPLLSLFSAFVLLPVFFAVPFVETLSTTRFVNAYIEMVSAVTTTGATLYQDPDRLSDTLHLWRAQVGWMGGLLMWVAASAILAPLHLGGFEVTTQAEPGRTETGGPGRLFQPVNAHQRLARSVAALVPIYSGLTLLLWLLLLSGGETPLVAICHAMSVMATSGISPIGGVENSAVTFTGEAVMALFMLFALSRLTFSKDTVMASEGGVHTDPEFRIGVFLVVVVPIVIFVQHFWGATTASATGGIFDAAQAFWGALFTVLSFLSTTGFVSEYWGTAQDWSGLDTSGLILMGLALMGGGVATTAGGVKLLRVFALYQNGARELERLVHPSSVSGATAAGRRLQSNGAFIAWIFFMLFAISIAGVTLCFALAGSSFEEALVLAVASLSTTGPLIEYAAEAPIALIELTGFGKAVLVGAMVLGRLETLAIVALLTPDLWRA